MDIKHFGNVGNNLILNPNQVANLKGVVNHRFNSTGLEPVYVLKKEDLMANHTIHGEGGLGSGKSLDDRFPKATAEQLEERRRQQIKNAQRKYRDANRDKYNEYMQGLYFKMANQKKFISGKPGDKFAVSEEGSKLPYSNPDEWYDYRLKQARVANAKYRLKKKKDELLKDLDNLVVKDLKKMFKAEHPTKKGRPGKNEPKREVFSPDTDWYKENFEKRKIQLQKEISEKGVVVPYDKRAKATKPDYPFKPDDIKVDDRKLYDKDKDAYKEKVSEAKEKEKKEKRQAKTKAKAEKKAEKIKEKAEEKAKEKSEENLPVEKTKVFKDWYKDKFGAPGSTFEEALEQQGGKVRSNVLNLYNMTH